MSEMPAVRGLTQIALFPQPRRSPASVDVYAVSKPARAFTGDFYLTHRNGDRLWFVVGDVAGKGVQAAVVMAMIQEELDRRITSCAVAGCNPATTMQRLDAFLQPILPSHRFATVVIGHLADNGTLTIVNGGHCPPLVLRRDGAIEEVASSGPVAGILKHAQWGSRTLHLERGESLLLYTDGVIESVGDDGELGVCGLRRALRAIPADASARILTEGVNETLRLRTVTDDVTIVAIRR